MPNKDTNVTPYRRSHAENLDIGLANGRTVSHLKFNVVTIFNLLSIGYIKQGKLFMSYVYMKS